jgi:hypothetical protein
VLKLSLFLVLSRRMVDFRKALRSFKRSERALSFLNNYHRVLTLVLILAHKIIRSPKRPFINVNPILLEVVNSSINLILLIDVVLIIKSRHAYINLFLIAL